MKLLETGHAYRCFCTTDALKVRREAAAAADAGGGWRYDRACLEMPEEERKKYLDAGAPSALRFRVPEGETTFNDFVHGPTVFRNEEIEDFVLLRSDGTPTYHLSVVSDDIEMEITHIVRGDDHISNTPKQILLYRALGYDPPTFAHLPLILGTDKKRLSKRHGAVSVLEYREMGILPQAMFNFLALLGWSPGEDKELLPADELVRLFSFEGINKAGAVFDMQKLGWLNGQYIMLSSAEELGQLIRPFLEKADLFDSSLLEARKPWYLALIELFKPRCRTLLDFVEGMRPFLTDEFDYEDEAVRKHLKDPETGARLRSLRSGARRRARLVGGAPRSGDPRGRRIARRGLGEADPPHPGRPHGPDRQPRPLRGHDRRGAGPHARPPRPPDRLRREPDRPLSSHGPSPTAAG